MNADLHPNRHFTPLLDANLRARILWSEIQFVVIKRQGLMRTVHIWMRAWGRSLQHSCTTVTVLQMYLFPCETSVPERSATTVFGMKFFNWLFGWWTSLPSTGFFIDPHLFRQNVNSQNPPCDLLSLKVELGSSLAHLPTKFNENQVVIFNPDNKLTNEANSKHDLFGRTKQTEKRNEEAD